MNYLLHAYTAYTLTVCIHIITSSKSNGSITILTTEGSALPQHRRTGHCISGAGAHGPCVGPREEAGAPVDARQGAGDAADGGGLLGVNQAGVLGRVDGGWGDAVAADADEGGGGEGGAQGWAQAVDATGEEVSLKE